MTFREAPDRRASNRRLARGMAVDTATMADDTPGVVIRYGRGLLVLNDREAIRLADSIVDALERHE